jgi:hypothetical protein
MGYTHTSQIQETDNTVPTFRKLYNDMRVVGTRGLQTSNTNFGKVSCKQKFKAYHRGERKILRMKVVWFTKINSDTTHNGEFYQFRGEQSKICKVFSGQVIFHVINRYRYCFV